MATRIVMADDRPACTGTLIEHELGLPECSDDGCVSASEQHWLVVACDVVACRCGRPEPSRGR